MSVYIAWSHLTYDLQAYPSKQFFRRFYPGLPTGKLSHFFLLPCSCYVQWAKTALRELFKNIQHVGTLLKNYKGMNVKECMVYGMELWSPKRDSDTGIWTPVLKDHIILEAGPKLCNPTCHQTRVHTQKG